MAWIAALAKGKEKTVTFGAPERLVRAEEPSHPDEGPEQQLGCEEGGSLTLPTFTKGLLVLDANAIIKGMDNLTSVADAFVTTAQVTAEIRDRASRELLERLSPHLTVRDPSADALAAVLACAGKTGDLGAMSRTDLRLCALALDCCTAGGTLGPAIEPLPATVHATCAGVRVITEGVSASDDDVEETSEPAGASSSSSAVGEERPGWGPARPAEESEGEWITSANLHRVRNGGVAGGATFDGGIACVTSDYAMQNTLLHLGVAVVGTSGLRIHELRLWLLRCTACFTVMMDTTRQFCAECGAGNTLRRVHYRVNDRGEKQLFINFKKHISTRGTIYNLPKPRGGKRGTNRNLVLREDQLGTLLRGTTSAKAKEKYVRGGGDDELAAFGEAPKRRKRNLAEPKTVSSYHKYNVTEKKKVRAAHRK